MIVFRKARRSERTLNDLDAYISGLGSEPIEWLEREVRRWGEFSYDDIEQLLAEGKLEDLELWRERYSKVINEIFAPMWIAAIEAAALKAARTVISDSEDWVQNWLEKHGAELVTNLSEETRKAIANVIISWRLKRLDPKIMARQIRPLIGLNERQVRANDKYRERVYENYLHMGEALARSRSEKAALRYASKQHRFRAETIIHTELAFAYNQGAHEGVQRAIAAGRMNRCEMIWTTAGTNRVCGRCLELKDKSIGFTDDEGVQLPPLHPRCRCAIIYREVGEPRVNHAPKNPEDIKAQHTLLTRELAEARERYRTLSEEIYRETSPAKREALYARHRDAAQRLIETQANLKAIRVKAAQKNVVLTSALSQSCDVEDIVKIVEKVRAAPKNIRMLWNLAEGEMKILDKDFYDISHYDPAEHGIRFDLWNDRYDKTQKQYKVLFHELGHLVDHFMGKRMYFYSCGYKGELFADTLRTEAQDFIKATLSRLKQEALVAGQSPKSIKLTDAYKALSKELQGLEHLDRREVSDIWSGATKNKVRGGYYHKTDYWKEAASLPTEAFAHMFCATIQNPESLALIKKYFPKSYGVFEEMIEAFLQEELRKWIGKNSTE